MAASAVTPAQFPAPSKSISTDISGKPTSLQSIRFADKILITLSQTGVMSHWVHVPLAAASTDPASEQGRFPSHDTDNALLPLSHLTATTVLGGTKRDDEIFGQTLATTIASSLLVKRPDEQRLLIFGLGLADAAHIGRTGFDALVGAVLDLL